jgi:acetyltransferase-like isoleucine patch superfamily enzyme
MQKLVIFGTRQGITIGEGVVIEMGAVATKDVPAGETWFSNPAKAR